MLSLKPSNVKRYKDIGCLFFKYGLSDLVAGTSLSESLDDESTTDEFQSNKHDHDGKPEAFTADLEALGPTFVKLGQVLASRGDLLPASYVDALARLQDDVAEVPFKRIEHVMFEELGTRVDVAFQRFDRTPMAAASLGQVHKAILHDDQQVAVKVQRPGIRSQVAEDIEGMMEIAKELEAHSANARRYEFCAIVETLAERLRQELRYTHEAANADRLRKSVESFPRITVPKIYDGLTTDRVLTMEFVTGRKITDLSAQQIQDADGRQLAEELFQCYLHQLLVDGSFHADPHPGNMLLADDGRICLLDFGLVVGLDQAMQQHLTKLLLHLSEGDGEQVAIEVLSANSEMGQTNQAAFQDGIVRLVSKHGNASLDRMRVGQIVMDIQKIAAENGVRIREEIKLLGKTLMQLDEVILKLDPEFDPSEMLKQNLADIVRRTQAEPSTAAQLFQMFAESSELAKSLPQRLNRFTRMLSQNEVRVKVDTIDETAFLRGMHKIANRITTGLILAALIVGASLMMRLETQLTIFGYPAIAMFFFLTAAISGLLLVYKASFTDDRDIE